MEGAVSGAKRLTLYEKVTNDNIIALDRKNYVITCSLKHSQKYIRIFIDVQSEIYTHFLLT